MERRVVITGLGAVSCAGNSVPALWENLVSGRSGIGRITSFDDTGLPCPAGEVKDFTLLDTTPKEARRMSRNTRFAVGAAAEAMKQARITGPVPEPFRFGVLFSSGAGGVEVYDQNAGILEKRGPDGVSPFFIPKYMPNGAGGTLAIRWGLKGPNFDPVSACASSAHAIGESAWMIRRGDADLMLAGGTEACLTRLMTSGFYALTALSRTSPPEKACRPFDLKRDGFVLAEGAAALVLEELEHARKRGAEIIAEVAGYGCSCDGTHLTAPDPSGAGIAYAIGRAMETARTAPETVRAVYAHGTGTPVNDRVEARALQSVFGPVLKTVKVSAVKSMIGHALSASGALAAVAAAQTLNTGILPPTINYSTFDPECPLDVNSSGACRVDTEAVLIDALGFGGHNAALILKRWEEK
ncbi:MAG: beta-ketoacyl-ACP synthase II [Lentisphaeria bacterium]|nr:beta-ketoacyl-ACP synthase II [Lentisphaeria bacterium]